MIEMERKQIIVDVLVLPLLLPKKKKRRGTGRAEREAEAEEAVTKARLRAAEEEEERKRVVEVFLSSLRSRFCFRVRCVDNSTIINRSRIGEIEGRGGGR